MPDSSRKLVVVCGAGASTDLGADGRPIPLMPQLNDAVCNALDGASKGYATALQLRHGMSGTEFETALGDVFALERAFGRIEQLRDLFLPNFTNVGSHRRHRDGYIKNARNHLDEARTILRDTLFDEFGGRRVDRIAAANAWTMLVDALHVNFPDLLVATTNYDPSATRGLQQLEYVVRRGFSARESEAKILEPQGLGTWQEDSIAVIHLHGAVGWYRTSPDRIEDHGADHREPIEALGSPALLYPEPNKDPDRGVVKELWGEFDTALSVASKVLVVGHSLTDDHLVKRLQPHTKKLAILRRPADAPSREAVERETRRVLVGASVIWGQFGRDGHIENDKAFGEWWGQESAVPQPGMASDVKAEASN